MSKSEDRSQKSEEKKVEICLICEKICEICGKPYLKALHISNINFIHLHQHPPLHLHDGQQQLLPRQQLKDPEIGDEARK